MVNVRQALVNLANNDDGDVPGWAVNQFLL